MKSKTKRILAFLCAVVLVATTVLGNWYTKQAEAATSATPVSLDGYENITIKDFKDADTSAELTPGTGTSTGYKRYLANGYTSFDNVLLSMKVNFAGGTYATRLDVAGGASSGWYSGLWVFPSDATGTKLKVQACPTDTNGFYGMTDGYQVFEITPTEAGVEKFVGEEFILQLAFDFGEEVNGKADLTLGVYINGKLAKSHTFTGCNTAKFGSYLNFVNGANITYDNVEFPTVIEPVVLDGFENLTISDFAGDGWRNQGQTLAAMTVNGGEYWGYAETEHTSFDKKLVSLNITFEGGTYANSLMFGGNATWVGFNLYPSEDGSELVVAKTWGSTITSSATPTLSATTAGVDSFIGEEFLLQMSFEHGEVVDGKTDLKLGIYINGKLYNNEVFTIAGCDVSTLGARIAFYPQTAGTNMIVGEEVEFDVATVIGPVTVDGFENLTISDFAGDGWRNQGQTLTAMTVNGGEYWGYAATGHTNFDKKLVSLNITFEGGTYANSLMFGGNATWVGFNLYPSEDGSELVVAKTWGSTITSSATPTLSAATAGVGSFIGEEFLLQMSFEHGEVVDGKTDLKLGIYINGKLYNNEVFTIADCDVNTLGARIAFYPQTAGTNMIVGEEVEFSTEPEVTDPFAGYEEVTIKDFVDGSGNIMEEKAYTCSDPTQGTFDGFTLSNHTSFDKKVLSMNVKFKDGGATTRIDVAGAGKWKGLMVYPTETGEQLYILSSQGYGMTDSNQAIVIDAATAGVSNFVDEQFLLQLTFDYGTVDSSTNKADVTVGAYINGNLCNSKAFTGCNMSTFGNYMGLYRQSDTSTIIVGSINEEFPEDSGTQTPAGNGEPVELDGYENLTIKNFEGLIPGTCYGAEGDGTYTGGNSAYDHTDFDNVVLSMKLTFTGGTYKTRMEFGSKGQWGFALHPNADGSELQIRNYSGMTTTANLPTMTATAAGVDSFLNEEFLLQMSFDYSEVVDGRRDVTLGVYINGELYNNQTFTITDCDATKLGSCLGFYSMVEGANITYDDVILSNTPDVPEGPGEVDLSGYEEVTIKDFVDASGKVMEEKAYTCPDPTKGIFEGFSLAKHADFNKKVLSMNVMFKAGGYGARIDVTGSEKWKGLMVYPATTGDKLYVMATTGYCGIDSNQSLAVDATTAGISSFIDTQFLMQLTFDFSEAVNGKTDLTVGVYINRKLCKSKTFAGCDANSFGNQLGLYRQADDATIIVGSVGAEFPEDPGHQPTGRYTKITFQHFGIADGKYPYVSGNMAVSGTASKRTTLDKTVICGDILLEGSDSSQIIWGGQSAWNGLRMFPNSDGTMRLAWYEGDTQTTIATLDSEVAGVAFVGEKYNIMLSSELVDNDGDGNVNDIKIGIWFNGVLYNQEYFYATDWGNKYGNYFSVYCAEAKDTVTLNSIPELLPKLPNENFEKITFQYFGVEDGTYKCDGTDASTFSGKGLENLDQKVLCGDILFSGGEGNELMLGGKESVWYGLRFITKDDGTILLIWVDKEGTPYIEKFDSDTAGTTLIGEWVNLMISSEIVDADGDGAKDDIEFGFWFNGVLYKDQYYTLIDKASGLGKYFGFNCANEDNSISIRSIPEYVKGFDYSVYGLTEDWEKTLLDTGFSSKMEVGGSRDPEPFTGDWISTSTVYLLSTVAIVAIAVGIYVVLQRRKNYRG